MVDKKLVKSVKEEVNRLEDFLSKTDKEIPTGIKNKIESKFCDIIICLSDINNFLEILWYNNNL